jgi:arsenate reductase
MKKAKVLFLCTGNSCRSQMAEGWTRHLLDDLIEVHSAGTITKGLNPHAIRVMQEAGVNISQQTSKTTADVQHHDFDLVVTVCGHANESCPAYLKKGKVIHIPFDDPPQLAEKAASESEALEHYRRVREEIREFVNKKLTAYLP